MPDPRPPAPTRRQRQSAAEREALEDTETIDLIRIDEYDRWVWGDSFPQAGPDDRDDDTSVTLQAHASSSVLRTVATT